MKTPENVSKLSAARDGRVKGYGHAEWVECNILTNNATFWCFIRLLLLLSLISGVIASTGRWRGGMFVVRGQINFNLIYLL